MINKTNLLMTVKWSGHTRSPLRVQKFQASLSAPICCAGELADAVKRSHNHRNVAVYASARDHEHAVGDDFTRVWHTANHSATCMREVFKVWRHATAAVWSIMAKLYIERCGYGSWRVLSTSNSRIVHCKGPPPHTKIWQYDDVGNNENWTVL